MSTINWDLMISMQQMALTRSVYIAARSYVDLMAINTAFIDGRLATNVGHFGPINGETELISKSLLRCNQYGFITTSSQPGYIVSGDNDLFRRFYTGIKNRDFVRGIMPKVYTDEFVSMATAKGLVVTIDYEDTYGPEGKLTVPFDTSYDSNREDEHVDFPLKLMIWGEAGIERLGYQATSIYDNATRDAESYKEYITPTLYNILINETVDVMIVHPEFGYHETDVVVADILEDLHGRIGLPEKLRASISLEPCSEHETTSYVINAMRNLNVMESDEE